MNKRFLTFVIVLFVACFVLCGCSVFAGALGDVEMPNSSNGKVVNLYICGAVECEGYYQVAVGTDYVEAIRMAGILEQSYLPSLNTSYVDGKVSQIIVDYVENNVRHSSINVNSGKIIGRWPVDGLSQAVVNKIADYIETNGHITNRIQLAQALGNDYAANYYKLFISRNYYEL